MKKRNVALLVVIALAVLLIASAYVANRFMKEDNAQTQTYQFADEEKLQDETYRFLTENGFSHIQASAIMAEIKVQSNFDSTATEINGLGYGLLQWVGVRKENLEKFADSQGKSSEDYEIQLRFLLEEVNPESEYYANLDISYHGYEWTDFLQATDTREAVETFCMLYERPCMPNLEIRGKLAEIYSKFYSQN